MVDSSSENFEFVKKFSYRDYHGVRTTRFNRIFSLATFEMVNTWKKSLIGKLLLGFVLFTIVFGALLNVPAQANQLNQINKH